MSGRQLHSVNGIAEPVFLIGAPRSGTTLLYSLLASSRELWSLLVEGEAVYSRYCHPARFGWKQGNRVTERDVSPSARASIRRELYRRAMNPQRWFPGRPTLVLGPGRIASLIQRLLGESTRIAKPTSLRLVEKTPRNSLRVPLLAAIFPDARYVYLTRDGRANVSSLLEGWRAGRRFHTYRMPHPLAIEGYSSRSWWCFALPPGWQEYAAGHTLAEVCAFQYCVCNEMAFKDLATLPESRVARVRYEDLVENPNRELRRLCEFLGIAYCGGLRVMAERLPPLNYVSMPSSEKWRRYAAEIETIMEKIKPTMATLGYSV